MTKTLEQLYFGFLSKEKNACAVLWQLDWFYRTAEFDPKSGAALPQALSVFLAKVAYPLEDVVVRDRLWRIAEHSRASVGRLVRSLNESSRREQALLPIHAVREINANSFIKLSNRPGRTIREKLAAKPYMHAVRRFQTVDLLENRLLKAFLLRILEILVLRKDCLGHQDELLPIIQSWLRSEEAQAIGDWDNLPPNNALIAHRDYRHVWDSWRWLQALDDDISRDFSKFEEREKSIRHWQQFARMWANGRNLFAEMPLSVDCENFEIRPWSINAPLYKISKNNIPRRLRDISSAEPICIDLAVLRPCYSCGERAGVQSLPYPFLWQSWQRDDEVVQIELFGSDAAWLHRDAITVSALDLFIDNDRNSEILDQAARAFSIRLRRVFKSDTLIWLAPDFLNDFELEVIRRNLNAHFPNSGPLPRSVAAVFAQADPAEITREGYAIVVVDFICGRSIATRVVAKFDTELARRVPVTRGFYWERCPPVLIPGVEGERTDEIGYDISTVDAYGQWRDAILPARPPFIEKAALKRLPGIGDFASCIYLADSPVVGGVRLHALQQEAGDIPLWRDQIPELSIKVMKDGRQQRFHVVARGTTVKPIRGKTVSIPVEEKFTLFDGRSHYSFPLYIGDDANDLGFSARLDSPFFPLKAKAECELNLTFEYGADDPYKLIFTPLDKRFPPIQATWRRTDEIISTDAPAPEYPHPLTWENLRFVSKPGSDETSDLLHWVQQAIWQFDRDYIRPRPRTTGVIRQKWLTDKYGAHFTFAMCNATKLSVLIHQNSFSHGVNYSDFSEGQGITFELEERGGKYSGRKVGGLGYVDEFQRGKFDEKSVGNIISNIRKRLYFPVIKVWGDGRSITDPECPRDFSEAMKVYIDLIASLLANHDIPELVRNEIRFLLACMHKDAPGEISKWISEQVESTNILDFQAVGFALGDVSQEWQKALLSKLVASPTNDSLSVFAYSIWRQRSLVERFSHLDLVVVLECLSRRLEKINFASVAHIGGKAWLRATVETLELLLGLLRTRASFNPEIKMILQPHQKITKKLAKQVERVTEIIVESNVEIFSRVQVNVKKPVGDLTPDLLFALRLYLIGDDGANAVHISSVSDGDRH